MARGRVAAAGEARPFTGYTLQPDIAILVGTSVWLIGHPDRPFARPGRLHRIWVDPVHLQSGRNAELCRRRVFQRGKHEIAEHRRGKHSRLLAAAKAVMVVVADIDPGGEVWGKADKPGVAPIAGGTGLAGDRLADHRDPSAGAAL